MTAKKNEENIDEYVSEYISEFLKNRSKISFFYDEVLSNLKTSKRIIFYIYNKVSSGIQPKIHALELKNQKICSQQTAYTSLRNLERYKFISLIEERGKYKSYEIINIDEWKKLIEIISKKEKELLLE